MAIHEDLIRVGLTPKEAQTYLALLELGPATVASIGQKAGLKRTTVYEVIDSLSQKGLISQTTFGKRKRFIAEPPEKFFRIKNQELETLRKLVPNLEALRNVAIEKPMIQLFQGKDGIMSVFEDMISNTDPIKDKLYAIESDPYILFERLGEKFFVQLLEKKNRSGLESLTLDTLGEKEIEQFAKKYPWGMKHDLTLKYLDDKDGKFKFNLYLYQNKIAIIAANQMIALIIGNQRLKDSFVFLFDKLWSNAEKSKYTT